MGRYVEVWQPRDAQTREVAEERKRKEAAKQFPVKIRMRGVPFKATRYDILRWLKPVGNDLYSLDAI